MLFRKENLKWVVITLFALALIPVIITAYEVIITEEKSVMFLGNYHPNVIFLVISYYVALLCAGMIWLVSRIIFIRRLKNEKLKAELTLLAKQVSPHFFFNMLNNLYGLAGKDAQKAQELILKLSDLMRYSIYEGEKESVALQQEIHFLKNFIELHKIRYHKQILVEFNHDVDPGRMVTPLLFIILVENAFKHGVESLRENAYIKANMVTNENSIYFTIENNYAYAENESGIGLTNLKKRLAFIYPKQHQLTFLITENVYKVQLILKQL